MTKLDELRIRLGNELATVNSSYLSMVIAQNNAKKIADEISSYLQNEINKPNISIMDCEFGG